MKKLEAKNFSGFTKMRELVSAITSQPVLAYPLYLFLVVGTGAAGYNVYQQHLEQRRKEISSDLQNVFLKPEPTSDSEPIQEVDTVDSSDYAPVISESFTQAEKNDEVDLDKEFLEFLRKNITRALEVDFEKLTSIQYKFTENQTQEALSELKHLSSRLRIHINSLANNPFNLQQKEKALRNLTLLKSILESYSSKIPLLERDACRSTIVEFLQGYVLAMVIFPDQVESEYASNIQTKDVDLKSAFQKAIDKASNPNSPVSSMQDINTILANFQAYPPSTQSEALQLLRRYIEDSQVPGTRRAEIAQSYTRIIDQTISDERQKKLLKEGLPDLLHYQYLKHLEETVILTRRPDQQLLSTILSDLRHLRTHLPREEYLRALHYVHNQMKVSMMMISFQSPSQSSTRRDDWIGFDQFLERTIKPLFMEMGSLPDADPGFNSRIPDSN